MLRAEIIFKEKRVVLHEASGRLGIAEIRVWKIPSSPHYPEGRKFSLFLVLDGKVVVGIDNHRPKGPHIHRGQANESQYSYTDEKSLIEDFWDLVHHEGFKR